MRQKLHFLDSSKAILDQAVDFLTRDWTSGPLDLRNILIIVPTRHAGRRLRERLASAAAARGTAVLIGPVKTPAVLFAPEQNPSRPVASDVIADAFWRRTLAHTDPARLSALGPAALVNNPAARASTADHLSRLRATLCEEGFDLASFAARTTEEKDRWECLANLEKSCLEEMEKEAWRDDVTEKLQLAGNPSLPEGTSRIVVLFVPDPPPLALKALATVSKRMAVDICVHAHPSESDLFDEWGRPQPEKWQAHPLPLEASQVEVCDDSVAMIELIRRRIQGLTGNERSCITVGVGDAQTAARLADILRRDDLPAFDPAGRPVSSLPLFTLITRLFAFRKEGTYLSFMNLARHPDALKRLEDESKAHHVLLATLDEFQNQQMPVTFGDACELASSFSPEGKEDDEKKTKTDRVATALNEAGKWLSLLDGKNTRGAQDPLSKTLPATLAHIYRGSTADKLLRESANVLRSALDRLTQIETISKERDDSIDLLQRFLASPSVTPERPDQAIELLGWLELAWEDAPVILLADLNDGVIPEAVTAHPFLPDTVRREMGLRDNRYRLARDAHTLQSILKSRQPGNVRGFMPRRSPSGDPLKPSRLLLQCEPGELAKRALYFFSDASSPFPSATRGPGWYIAPALPGPGQMPNSISATGFRSYLDCPFKFYLERILRVKDPYEDMAELDPGEFGNVCHAVLKAFADSAVKDSASEKDIGDFLRRQTGKEFRTRFGENLTLPLMIQRDVMLQRMSYAAPVQARLRSEGWRILDSEWDFETQLDGLSLKGRLDRIDLNEKDGRLRIIDYKTSARAELPEKAHRSKITARSTSLPCARTADGQWAWNDLQLPLYVHAYRTVNPECRAPIETAYFALPNAVGDTDILLWDNMDQSTIESALECAIGIIRRIRAGVFWPPNQRAYRPIDPFYRLFFDHLERFLDPAFVEAMNKIAEGYETAQASRAKKGDG